jgi:uncharacterized protein (TIGR02246 family)
MPGQVRMTSAADEKDAIRELMAQYCYALDACDFASVAGLFAIDGEWMTNYGSARGRTEIEALLQSVVPRPGEGPQRKHYITNIIVKLDGNRAAATSDYLVVRESQTGLLPVMGGRYKDKFVKNGDTWSFARKELEHHIFGDMALKNGR